MFRATGTLCAVIAYWYTHFYEKINRVPDSRKFDQTISSFVFQRTKGQTRKGICKWFCIGIPITTSRHQHSLRINVLIII